MTTRSILLGGAIALALTGAGYAQQAGSSPPKNSAQTSQTSQTQTKSHHARMVRHYRHHMRHQLRTATLHAVSSPAERRETNSLNAQQLRTVGYGPGPQYAPGAAPQYRPNPTEPGQDNGLTPSNRIPNADPYGTATSAGGRQDTPAVDQSRPR